MVSYTPLVFEIKIFRHLRFHGTNFRRFHGARDLPVNPRAVDGPRGSYCRGLHGDRARLHAAVRRRQLRQRGHRHLRPTNHFLRMAQDQVVDRGIIYRF